MKLAPIVLFVYNRPIHTRQTLESLKKNPLAKDSLLIVFADGPKNDASEETIKKIGEVRKILSEDKWCKKVIIHESKHNKGLAKSIMDGVTEVVNKYGRVIVLEDDLELSPGFLKYMNEALELYKDEEKVMHIAGYFPPVAEKLPETFFYNQASCWGWATWSRAWKHLRTDYKELLNEIEKSGRLKEFDLNGAYRFSDHLRANIDGRIKTWAILWHASVFLKNGLCLHPNKSLVRNVGLDGSGQHCKEDSYYYIKFLPNSIKVRPCILKENTIGRNCAIKFYSKIRRSLVDILIEKIWYFLR